MKKLLLFLLFFVFITTTLACPKIGQCVELYNINDGIIHHIRAGKDFYVGESIPAGFQSRPFKCTVTGEPYFLICVNNLGFLWPWGKALINLGKSGDVTVNYPASIVDIQGTGRAQVNFFPMLYLKRFDITCQTTD